ncbi:hypothetical protein [Thermocatellispora tengchongensis]|uniref:hypothetical protein n=1 Tax=Thermocatellispora tengchongensis TaxID=1073253 RepID=UPI0036329C3B
MALDHTRGERSPLIPLRDLAAAVYGPVERSVSAVAGAVAVAPARTRASTNWSGRTPGSPGSGPPPSPGRPRPPRARAGGTPWPPGWWPWAAAPGTRTRSPSTLAPRRAWRRRRPW